MSDETQRVPSARKGLGPTWPKGSCRRMRQTQAPDASWLAALDQEGVRTIVLDRHQDRTLLRALRRSGRWVVDFMDRQGAILVRGA